MLVANRMLVDVGKSRRDGMLVANRVLVDVDKSRRDGMLVEDGILDDELIPTDMSSLRDFCRTTNYFSTNMSSLRDFSKQRIDFYQYLVPNGTKIERKYFYVNITFLTPHPFGTIPNY
jgi:hypothetical protein